MTAWITGVVLGGEWSMPIPNAVKRATPSDMRVRGERGITFMGDDAALVEALRERKPAAVAAFHDRYAKYVLRVLVRILGHDRDLQDVLHEAFVRALGSIAQLRDASRLTPWMTSVAVLTARSCIQRRHRKRWLMFLSPSDLPDSHDMARSASPETVEALQVTYKLFERMPTDERILFALRYIEGLELLELAVATNTSLATLKRRLSRAERRFATMARLEPALRDWVERGGRWTVV